MRVNLGGGGGFPIPAENACFGRAAALTSKAGWSEVHGAAALCADARYACVRPAPRTKFDSAVLTALPPLLFSPT